MADNIRSQAAFLDTSGRPAWHSWGTIINYLIGAVEARRRIGGYDVWTEAVKTESGLLVPGQIAVVRGPTREQDTTVVFGLTEDGTHVINPMELAEIWDTSCGIPVETMGDLGQGEQTFITCKLPGIGVNGEDVELYLLLDVNYLGDVNVRVVHIRVVCQNTLTMARNDSRETHTVNMKQQPHHQLAIILEDLPRRMEERAAALQETFTALANTSITEDEHVLIRDTAAQLPFPPKYSGDKEVDEKLGELYQKRLEQAQGYRAMIDEVYDGAGRGMDITPSLWKSYNAVVEVADWYRSPSSQGYTLKSLFSGAKATMKERAWMQALELISS